MIAPLLALAVTFARPTALDAWRWNIEEMGWTFRAATADRQVEVFTRPVTNEAGQPQLLVRTERYQGPWKSQSARVALDCAAGRVTVVEAQAFGGMNLSGEVLGADRTAALPLPEPLLQPILASACGS
jgi:hypothetical protein